MGTPSQPAVIPLESASDPTPQILTELYTTSNAQTYSLTQAQFEAIFAAQAGSLAALNPQYRNDYILAQACAQGHNHAWEHFLALYRQPLTRAAIAIAGPQGEDLAEALYAELFGLTAKPDHASIAIRKSPLASYKGRGSLIGWLRTTLAQRHVDHHRKTWREQPLPSFNDPANRIPEPAQAPPEPSAAPQTIALTQAVQQSIAHRAPEDRFLLAAYFLDQQTLLQIAQILHVHEATVSRRLHRLLEELRKDLLVNLQTRGLSQRAAQEALGTDPRDFDPEDLDQLSRNLKNLLQNSPSNPFQEQAGQ